LLSCHAGQPQEHFYRENPVHEGAQEEKENISGLLDKEA
jgi:hypothetical protein